MAKINRSDIIQKAVNDCAISVANDKVPTETLDKVQLIYSLNNEYSSWTTSLSGNSTGKETLTLPTTDARSEIYLTSLDFDVTKNAACDAATGQLIVQCTPADVGTVKTIMAMSIITLTAQDKNIHIDFKFPMKLKPNTTITASGTYGAGIMQRSLTATGFTKSSN